MKSLMKNFIFQHLKIDICETECLKMLPMQYSNVTIKCDALRDLAPFVQFKKREKRSWKNVTFSKVADNSLQLY